MFSSRLFVTLDSLVPMGAVVGFGVCTWFGVFCLLVVPYDWWLDGVGCMLRFALAGVLISSF